MSSILSPFNASYLESWKKLKNALPVSAIASRLQEEHSQVLPGFLFLFRLIDEQTSGNIPYPDPYALPFVVVDAFQPSGMFNGGVWRIVLVLRLEHPGMYFDRLFERHFHVYRPDMSAASDDFGNEFATTIVSHGQPSGASRPIKAWPRSPSRIRSKHAGQTTANAAVCEVFKKECHC
jgi:hypothetical protein